MTILQTVAKISLGSMLVALTGMAALKLTLGMGGYLPDMSTKPRFDPSVLELVADLAHPPGNIAVSKEGRVFISFHPDKDMMMKVGEIVTGKVVPFPDSSYQEKREGPWFDTVLSLRIDRQNRLWTLDHGFHGFRHPRILAFDLGTGALVYDFSIPSEAAGIGSMMNDFQVDAEGAYLYIADASIVAMSPAVLVLDIRKRKIRRVLGNHPLLHAENLRIRAGGRDMKIAGIIDLRPNIDSIGLDKRDEWLYFGPLAGRTMYRIRTADLRNEILNDDTLASCMEPYAGKSMSGGITIDLESNIYISDVERSAIHMIRPDRTLVTLVKTERLRWPDGFSFGPDGWLYVTCSALQDTLFMGADHVKKSTPFQVFRFKPGPGSIPGH
jgi:sugar lactone lactonase YvrE